MCAAVALSCATGQTKGAADNADLLAEVERLKAEVERLKVMSAPHQASQHQQYYQQPPPQQGGPGGQLYGAYGQQQDPYGRQPQDPYAQPQDPYAQPHRQQGAYGQQQRASHWQRQTAYGQQQAAYSQQQDPYASQEAHGSQHAAYGSKQAAYGGQDPYSRTAYGQAAYAEQNIPYSQQQNAYHQQANSFGQASSSQAAANLDPFAASRELAALRENIGNLAGKSGLAGLGLGNVAAAASSVLGGAASAPSESIPRPFPSPGPGVVSEDGCSANPIFAKLQTALQKLALLEQDPIEASFQIHEAWERDPSIFETCPVGVVTAIVYLSIAQDKEWKYNLLHRATYMLYSTAGLASMMARSRWPMSDRLIRTMYYNSEVLGRQPLRFAEVEVAPRGRDAAAAGIPGVDEAVDLSLRHRDTVTVHFKTVLFYHFYLEEKSPCACRTRSWCLPSWTRHLTNSSVDIWLAARDEQKTLFRMDRSGCFRSTGHGLSSHYFAEPIDLVFVFEINAFMHAQCRVLPARRMLLYPTYDLSEEQMKNFEDLGVSVLPDDAVIKPPNMAMHRLLDEAVIQRKALAQKTKDRLLVFPAEIRPMKGQLEFLRSMVFETTRKPSAVSRLRGLTIVMAGGCDGNGTYCDEVLNVAQKINDEGFINLVIADSLKDEELAQIYAASLGLVLHSRIDCNPRTVYEALIADTPFLVPEATRLPESIHHLGHIVDGDSARVPEYLADFVDLCEAGGFVGRPREFARRHIKEAEIYRSMLQWMDEKYLSGKTLDSVIRGEEAMGAFGSAGLGGLGALLGLGGGAAGGAGSGGGAGLGGLAGLAGLASGGRATGSSGLAPLAGMGGGGGAGGGAFSMREPVRR